MKFLRDKFVFIIQGIGGRKEGVKTCVTCNGTGEYFTMQQIMPGMVQRIHGKCHNCQGKGSRMNEADMCKTCEGQKVLLANFSSINKIYCLSGGEREKNS